MASKPLPIIDALNELRTFGGPGRTSGLSDEVIERFARLDNRLQEVIQEATEVFRHLCDEEPALMAMDEDEQIAEVQAGFINFYPDDAIKPYVALVARGPWIITIKGAVIHDSGGYGMLGMGHAPPAVLQAMNGRQVMANIMTPNLSQKRLHEALKREIGQTRGTCPMDRFLCLNSGSEAVSLAARISDVNAKMMTDPGGRHANRQIRMASLCGGFHGRTDRPAQYSDSSRQNYVRHLASFRDQDRLLTVEPNNVEQLEQIYTWADSNNIFIESFFLEPVMGEGNPGQAISREFYDAVRIKTREHGSLMLVDSIQAGLRTHGVLSICDYPGFEDAEAPDMETYSKALNAGQYPLSVLALTEETAGLYRKGIYGNTMTTNPRAMDVACAVLNALTPELRQNIRERGREFVEKFKALQDDLGDRITQVQGTGLLFSVELNSKLYKCFGADSTEEYMRMQGCNVIHGGQNSLRYTPHFAITSEEVDLIVEATRDALLNGPMRASAGEAAAA
ncbi:aminotransferase class III-fold pyridoxal phosphate-dependent enzyme [Elongatibacter sediminis]|uniref:Aminotransferase class III-fold pyridoxal phosphate-dependent enzyme n=1 Tax=Elongatibacter sediminis TaxID=3119006 RepID=A0AAW9R8F6_9GAMM